MGKYREPQVGETIYLPSEYHVYRGEDDWEGGQATISGIERKPDCRNEYNRLFVQIAEKPGHSYNWNYLMENQGKWREQYGDQVAHEAPDFRPEFNDSEADWRSA